MKQCNGREPNTHIAIQWFCSGPCPLCASHRLIRECQTVLTNLFDTCDRLMGDSDLLEDDSFELKSMQSAIKLLEHFKEQENRSNTNHDKSS